VAEKRAVPKERVRLDKDVHTEEREVSDTVRQERIDVDDDAR
jgi:stress response protein YsnF